MNIRLIYPGSYAANGYLLVDGGHAVIVDPSASAADILRVVRSEGCELDAIWLTHGHFDHILAVDALRDAIPGLPVCVHEADAPMLTDAHKNAYAIFFPEDRTWRAADILLHDGQTITVGNTALTVMHTPGHSPGSVCFFSPSDRALLTGDTLFADNIGRADLWGGSHATLMQSLRNLREFSKSHPSLTIYPGHGDTNTLAKALDNAFYYF